MHFKILLLVFLSLFKPAKPSLLISAKKHKAAKVVKMHKHQHAYSKQDIDTAVATGCTTPDELIAFAKTLKGIRYRYGSTNPEKGFDCSGFVNYVFRHFGISIPRSSSDFASAYGRVDLKEAKYGDLILFTGTKRHSKRAGHIGIIVSSPGQPVMFIHSTSGNANGVTETLMDDYYMGRYMKTIRIFQDNQDADADDTVSAQVPH